MAISTFLNKTTDSRGGVGPVIYAAALRRAATARMETRRS
jgi:hypothetical protein